MYEVRKATQHDIEYVLDLRYTTIKAVCNLEKDYLFDEDFKKYTRDYCENSNQTTVLAFDDKIPIGCASICYMLLMPTFDHPTGKRAHIMNVYVDEAYRRKGIALRMMELLIEEAKQKEVTEISLDATDLGRALYKKCGFIETKEGMVLNIKG